MPNRVLRDWTTSEAIDKLSLGAEVFFTRLIMKADDFGNYTANEKLLKAALFPLREAPSIGAWLIECVKVGIIKKYSIEGKDYLNIPNFGQRLRAMKSQYPDISQSDDGHLSVNGRPETKGNEGKRNEDEKNGTKILGLKSDNYIIIHPKELHSTKYRIQGVDGLKEFIEMNGSIFNHEELMGKYLMLRKGKKMNDFQHLWNDYNLFVEKQFA